MLVKYKLILKKEGISGVDMSKLLGITYGSYRFSTRKSATVVPKWVISFVVSYELSEL